MPASPGSSSTPSIHPMSSPASCSSSRPCGPARRRPVVHPAANDPILIKRLLDIGVRSFLNPQVRGAAEVEQTIPRHPLSAAWRPRDLDRVAQRANRYGRVKGFLRQADDGICLLIQIETEEAFGEVDAVAGLDGVDGLFVGPSDLAASLGHPGDARARSCPEGFRRCPGCSAKGAGKPAGILAPRRGRCRRLYRARLLLRRRRQRSRASGQWLRGPDQAELRERSPEPGGGMIGIGMIGHGMMGRWHSEALKARRDCRLRHLVGRRPEPTAAFAAEFGYESASTRFENLLDDDAVDVAVVASPSEDHAAMAVKAFERGKHVLVEVPIGMSLAEATAVVESAGKKASRKLGIVYPFRMIADIRSLRARIVAERTCAPVREPVHHQALGECRRDRLSAQLDGQSPLAPPVASHRPGALACLRRAAIDIRTAAVSRSANRDPHGCRGPSGHRQGSIPGHPRLLCRAPRGLRYAHSDRPGLLSARCRRRHRDDEHGHPAAAERAGGLRHRRPLRFPRRRDPRTAIR